MRPMTQRIETFAIESFRELVESLLDDPSDLIHPDAEQPAHEVIAHYRALASDLGLSFNDLVEESGAPFQRNRLREIEAGTFGLKNSRKVC